jgi:hypothetical protein
MRFIHLITFFDFIQVLNSARKFYTKNLYFSNHKFIFYKFFTAEIDINP